MIKTILLTLILLLFTSCASKTPHKQWQRKSTNAFNAYTKNFLSDHDVLASSDLARAINHAKQSADLTQLAKIYLGECALNISVGINDSCQKYLNISDIVVDAKLQAYYAMMQLSIKKEQIKDLPSQYQPFAKSLIAKDFPQANKDLFKMPKLTSSLLAAGLIKDKVSDNSREKLIELASLYGYKKLILFWLARSKNASDAKKILILQSM